MTKSIILLSGGLDSAVVLGAFKDEYGINLALTFDYGQITADSEIKASQNLSNYYNIKHEVIKLEWLKKITNTALITGQKVEISDFGTEKSAKFVWVPNRNGLFLNIAACYADSFGYDYILFGANKDEGKTFPDNTEEFRQQVSKSFEYSTLRKPKVAAPLINYSKNDIFKIAVEKSVPLEYVRSCYCSNDGHCGECESCRNLQNALEKNNCKHYINILFKK